MATNISVSAAQRKWAREYTPAENTSSATTRAESLFSQLDLNAKPHPELYSLYFRDDEGSEYSLVRDHDASTTKIVHLYAQRKSLSYATENPPAPSTPKETFTTPRTTTYQGGRAHPKQSSTSYPEGVQTYYVKINGKEIRLDQGHGTPQADTHEHEGQRSAHDPENFVPQNIKYNHPIRSSFEAELREKKLSYKEISIYHNNCMREVTTKPDGGGETLTVPIPEGFVFMIFDKEGQVKRTYYFPNWVDYVELKGNEPDYKSFRKRYKVQDLADWFWMPAVTFGLTDEQQEQVDLAHSSAVEVLLFSQSFFKRLSEREMPPRARVALCTTLLEWNMEAAAALEFLSFENQLSLVHFYLQPHRNYWELDDRDENQKVAAVKNFMNDKSISSLARKLVKYLHSHLEFEGLQSNLQEFVNRFKQRYRRVPHYWETPDLYACEFTCEINSAVFTCNMTDIPPGDIPKMKMLLGGMESRNREKAQEILAIVDRRLRQIESSIMEKLHMLRIYHDEEYLPDVKMHREWEVLLKKDVENRTDVSLLDRRRIVEYYAFRNMENEKVQWLTSLVSHIEQNPTFDNFVVIAQWGSNGRSVLLQNPEEKDDPMRASNLLALQIYKGLSHVDPETYNGFAENIDDLQKGFGFDRSDHFGIIKRKILHPSILNPSISGKTGKMIKKLSEIFYNLMINQTST